MSARQRETWLLDLGNSRAKAARLAGGELLDVVAFDWDRADFDAALRAALVRWPRPDAVRVASVVAAPRAARVHQALAMVDAERIEWLRTPRAAGGIRNSYRRPERLGIDRFLAMLAAYARTRGACVVVGCGTALTLDRVAADGRHVEGMIALAPGGMLQALRGATAIADGNPDAFNDAAMDDTAAALHAGCWASAGALVEWFLARGNAEGAGTRVWLHGGWAQQLAEWLARDGHVVETLENAVLAGLAAWSGTAAVECRVDER